MGTDEADITWTTPVGSIGDTFSFTYDGGDLQPNTGGSATATVRLENIGAAPLVVEDMSLLGSGFSLAGALPASFTLECGDTLDVPIQLLDTTEPASATFQVTTNDPNQPTFSLPLSYDGTSLAATAPQATSFSAVASPRNRRSPPWMSRSTSRSTCPPSTGTTCP